MNFIFMSNRLSSNIDKEKYLPIIYIKKTYTMNNLNNYPNAE